MTLVVALVVVMLAFGVGITIGRHRGVVWWGSVPAWRCWQWGALRTSHCWLSTTVFLGKTPYSNNNENILIITWHGYASSPYWAAITSYPSACSGGMTLLKLEPSAQMPWTKTMLGLVCVDMVRSSFSNCAYQHNPPARSNVRAWRPAISILELIDQ
jgi:hypothetical protein